MTSQGVSFTEVQEELTVKREVSALHLLASLPPALSSLQGVCSCMLRLSTMCKIMSTLLIFCPQDSLSWPSGPA